MMAITTTARARLRALPDTGTTLVCREQERVAPETSHFDFFKPKQQIPTGAFELF
jgi:hypothetical protein